MGLFNHPDDELLRQQLASLGDEPLPGELDDAAMVTEALAGLSASAAGPRSDEGFAPAPAAERSRPRALVFIAAVALATAASVALTLWLPGALERREHQRAGSMAPATYQGRSTTVPKFVSRVRAALGHGVQQQPSEADADTEAVIELVPDDQLQAPEKQVTRRSTTLRPVSLTPDELLSLAQQQLGEGHTAKALDTYKRLVEGFGTTEEAKAARVSMGRIELSRDHPKAALAHFDAYLATSAGTLVEEARYGRIRALRQLGRREQERESIRAFLQEHGDGIYAPRLRRRMEELASP